jgi:pescadillo protein
MKKKGEAGAAKNFITRTKAVKKLQISLPDFRKLCIWKGIYPREPRNRKKASKSSTASTTFYYTKDIQYLLHEPLIQKFREQKALEKKISKALGRGDYTDAKKLENNAVRPDRTGKPGYTLDHVIRERYPTFADALRDLDDCLSMLFLFANLPSTSTVPAKMIARCERLCMEFQHYLIVSKSVTKSFLSIKGIYYQASIQGEEVLWLVPYKFNQRVVGDIDFRIMGTFIEFYMTLLGFVNFRLYTSVGLKYPPKFDQSKDEQSGELGAFTIEGQNLVTAADEPKQITDAETVEHHVDPATQAAVDKVVKKLKGADDAEDLANGAGDAAADEASNALDKFEPVVSGGDILPQPQSSGNDVGALFANCTFYLSRESPRQPLEFLLRAFGCKRIGWDAVLGEGAFTHDETDPTITHHVVDRPVIQAVMGDEDDAPENQNTQKLAQNQRIPGRVYVQPQWVWDSVNDEELKRPDLYAPGAQLPPHLSPFVKLAPGQYDPTVPLEEQETEGEALQESDAEDEEMADAENGAPDMDVADSDEEDEDDDSDFGGFDEDEPAEEDDEEQDEAAQRQLELEAEMTGKSMADKKGKPKSKKEDARKAHAKKTAEEAEDLERAKGMLSKKKRKLFEQMMYTNNKKNAEAEKLRAKKRKLEKQDKAKA